MPLSSAERLRRYMTKLKREENQPLLKNRREKDAARHLKSRKMDTQDPDKIEKIREQNRARQIERRMKLASQKLGLQLPISSPSTVPKSTYKSVQSLANAVHHTERTLPASPRRKEEIIRQLAVKHGVIAKSLEPLKPSKAHGNDLSQSTINNLVKFINWMKLVALHPVRKI